MLFVIRSKRFFYPLKILERFSQDEVEANQKATSQLAVLLYGFRHTQEHRQMLVAYHPQFLVEPNMWHQHISHQIAVLLYYRHNKGVLFALTTYQVKQNGMF